METRRPFRYHQPPYRGGGGAGRGSSILPGYPQPPPQGGRGPLIPTNPYGMQFPPPRQLFMPAQLGTMGGQRPPVHFIPPQSQFPHQIQHVPVFQPQVAPPTAMGQNPTTPQVISSSNTYSKGGSIMTGGYQGQSTQPYPQPKPKRTNAIRIIDPNTNEEVNVKASTATDSNSSSVVSGSSSLTSVRSNVAAEFQNKVHVALNPDASSDSTPKPNAIISIPNASEGKRTSSSISLTEDISSKNTSAQIETKPNLSDPGKQEPSTVPPSTSVEKSDGKDSVTVPLEASSSSSSDSGKLTSSKSEHNTSKADSPPSGSNSKSSPVPTPSPEVVANIVPPTKDTSVQLPKDVTQVIDSPAAAAEVSRNTPSVGTSSTEKQQPDQSSVTSVPAANTGEPQTKVPEDGKVAREGSRDGTATATVVTEKGQRPLEEQQQQPQQPVEKTKQKEDSGRKKSKGEQDSPKNSEERKKKEEPKTAAAVVAAAVGQSTLSLENKKSLMSEQVTTKDEYELEDGEIPPSEDKDEEVVMNGDHRQAFEAGFAPDDRKYGRNFLLEYRRLAMEPPESLRKMQDVFCPSGGGGSDYYIGGRRHKSANKKVIDHKPQAHEKVELHKAEHRWVRPVNQVIPEEEKQNQELFRKFQGILNKLTPQKFSDLANKALQLDITTEERLHGCIDRIFEKALEEPNFSIAYANLCRVMSNIKVNVIRVDEEGNQVTKETSFRRELLTKCQKEFEKDKRDDEQREEKLKAIEEATNEEERKKKQVEFDEWETSVRRRSLGNIRFIGELFKLKMLSEGIMHDCIMRLLKSTSDHESLECFCRLITTTGKDLDHPQAKQRMDKYFERMAEIIDKKKISSRIKFMLQDVQDLRKCEWVPRRQESLKTIDQIHLEAKLEAMAEQEMIKHMAVTSTKSYNRDDKKKGGGGKGDDPSSRKRSNLPQPPADVSKILGLRKKDGGSAPSLGPGAGLRPTSGWSNKKKDGQTPPPVEKDRSSTSKTGPQKSSTGGTSSSSSTKKQSGQTTTSGRSLAGPRRSSSQPNEKQAVLDALKQINQPPKKPVAPVPVDKFDENTLRRKTCTIVDEFAENKDYREAYDCVCELESPSLLGVFVAESILHTLEKSSHHREYAGRLLDYLIAKKTLSKEKIMTGLKEVIEMADDLEVDIPKLWDFFAEILCPLFLSNCLSLTDYLGLLNGAEIGYKAPRSIARLLQQCALRESKEAAVTLWTDSKLSWSSIGLDEEDQQDFIEREKLQFLSEGVSSFDNPAYFKDLQIMFGKPDTPNDEILNWIETQKLEKDLLFIRSLSRAAIETSTQGEGDSCILNDERFRSRLPLVKRYVDEDEQYQLGVLNAMEVSMNRLKHPPNMLSLVFWSLYDVEVVSEKACNIWKQKAEVSAGQGMALATTKNFFKWLDNADPESDLEMNS